MVWERDTASHETARCRVRGWQGSIWGSTLMESASPACQMRGTQEEDGSLGNGNQEEGQEPGVQFLVLHL